MRKIRTILLLTALLACLAATTQPAQFPGYAIQTFGVADGLSSSEITALFQDKRGFIWIGTREGASRYDGHRFLNFELANSERIGTVYSIAEDREGILWIAAESGLYRWTEKEFIAFPFKNEESYHPFYTLCFTHAGLWIGTLKGPVFLPSLHEMKERSIDAFLLRGWAEASRGDGLARYISVSGAGVAIGGFSEVYLYKNGRVTLLPNPRKEEDYLNGVHIDDEGTVYWNNVLSGFHYWDGKMIKAPQRSDGHYFDLRTNENSLFLYSNVGIMQLDTRVKKKTTLVNLEPLAFRMPTRFLMDKEGAYWLGATDGLIRITRNPFTLYSNPDLAQSDEIYSLLRRNNGELLLGANRGTIFSVKNSSLVDKKLAVVPSAEVFSMYEDGDDVWFGTGYQGMALLHNNKLQHYNTKNGLPDNSHYSFYKSSNGTLWSAGDMGITRIDKKGNDQFSFVPFFYNTPEDYHKVYGIAEAPDGSLWAGGWLGFFRLKKDSLHRYAPSELKKQKIFITSFKQKNKAEVWVTTRGFGILQCVFGADSQLHIKRQFQVEDGLLNNTYLSLAFDKEGNVWAGSHHGISILKEHSKGYFSVRNFDVNDGFINKTYHSLHMYADGDTMWALTSSGAVSFNSKALLQTSRKAPLYITEVQLLNSKNSTERFLINDNKEANLHYRFPYNRNSFSVHFAALHYSNPRSVRYYYRLVNMDSHWTSTGNEPAIFFHELQPGNYTLQIKALIGGSDETDPTMLAFEISKPWWRQDWLTALAALFLGGVVFLYIKNREKRIKEKEEQKIAFEKIKTAAFQYQLEIQQVINYFTSSMNKFASIDDMLWDVARNCISKLNFEDCVIYLLDEEKNVLQQKAAWGPKTTEGNKIVNPIEIPVGKGIVGTVALTGKAERINDTSIDPRYIVDDAARASEITVPVYDGEKVIGVIDSEHSEKYFYTERHLQILTTIASHCGARISTIKAENKTAAARMEALLSKQKALEASLQSMRLQMNPHFLFNALNSIQQMILSGEDITATKFLSKFSKLLRTVLTNSSKEEVSLKEEIEVLQLYVDLESLRFKEAFSYGIECDEAIDAEEIFIPALLLQPLVENAIWHGLMHKVGQRKLVIRFQEQEEGVLLCRIEDNGVGRHAAIKNSNRDAHTGKGLSVSKQRLEALNEKNGTNNHLHITDLKDERGYPIGTRIDIILYT